MLDYAEYCKRELDYEVLTTAFDDLSIAEKYGKEAIIDTCDNLFEEFKNNVKYFTELVMVLNHKIWFHYEDNKELAIIYHDLWVKLDTYACVNLKGEDAAYFYRITD